MKKKNKSNIYKDGIRVQTRDNHLYGSTYYDARHPNPKDLYRKTYIVDSNKNDELVIVKETTHRGTTDPVIDSSHIYYKDNLGNPIKVDNIKFKVKKKIRLSNKNLCKLKMDVFISNRNSRRNRRNVHIFVKKRK